MEIALLAGLILLNGLFAMSEIALVTARRGRLQARAEAGDAGAIAALKLGENPTQFMSTVQIGITSIGLLSGIAGEAALADPFAAHLVAWGMTPDAAHYLAMTVVVASVTYFSIVVGELVPKRFGQAHPDTVARRVAIPMALLAKATRPFVWLLTYSTKVLLRLLGVHKEGAGAMTSEDIQAVLKEGSESGVIEQHEHTMMRNVIRLDERRAASLMVPRGDVSWIDLDDTAEQVRAGLAQGTHHRMPVARGSLDQVLGIIETRIVLAQVLNDQPLDIEGHLKPPLFVPEGMNGMEVLDKLRRSSAPMAFVTDEYGDVMGILTQHDLLEAIAGEFLSVEEDDAWAIQREDGSWLLDGLTPLPILRDTLHLGELPAEVEAHYHTLNGVFLTLLGRLPHTTDHIDLQEWRLEVVDMDGHRIDKVLAIQSITPVEPE
ncbi:MAG: Magnesium and cobalt efflux protein CorC [Alphaproteobacteria bacterium ADurb.BinA280]|nr:HlyC/CorC family transporter [Xanthomonadales bacterium]MCC6504750.1 HlyC/CorC family transporter [Aquimonas sp.]OPZ12772.1 MAG: Magnesium and cobalt efflux protein CorC [Alphaproteobacteria bacterium ADurb.BinA280]